MVANSGSRSIILNEENKGFAGGNNQGIQETHGKYVLLLNNDTEFINGACLEELLGYCMHDDVGAVGARLYYSDDTIQHAGVVVGFGGIAGHAYTRNCHMCSSPR